MKVGEPNSKAAKALSPLFFITLCFSVNYQNFRVFLKKQ